VIAFTLTSLFFVGVEAAIVMQANGCG